MKIWSTVIHNSRTQTQPLSARLLTDTHNIHPHPVVWIYMVPYGFMDCFDLICFYTGNNPPGHIITFKNMISVMIAWQFIMYLELPLLLDINGISKGLLESL